MLVASFQRRRSESTSEVGFLATLCVVYVSVVNIPFLVWDR